MSGLSSRILTVEQSLRISAVHDALMQQLQRLASLGGAMPAQSREIQAAYMHIQHADAALLHIFQAHLDSLGVDYRTGDRIPPMRFQVGDYVRFRQSAWDDGLPRPHEGRVVRILEVTPSGVRTTHPRDVTRHRWGLALEFEAATEEEFLLDQLTH